MSTKREQPVEKMRKHKAEETEWIYDDRIALMLNLRLANKLGINSQNVYLWRKKGVPVERIIEVCETLKWAVTPHELDPNIYRNPTDSLPAGLLTKMYADAVDMLLRDLAKKANRVGEGEVA